MKKIFALAALICSVALVSCDNNDPAEEVTYNTFQTATVKGAILVQTTSIAPTAVEDYSESKPVWTAGQGLTVQAEVENNDITGEAVAGKHISPAQYNATTGEYSATVTVANDGSVVKVVVKEWNGSISVYDVDPEDNTTDVKLTKNGVWSRKEMTYGGLVEPNDAVTMDDILYTPAADFTPTVKVGDEI